MTSQMKEWGDGDGSLDALFKRFYRPLVVFADAILHHAGEAEDLVQEQFVKLWDRGEFARVAPGALSTFLFTVVKNACINFLERRRLPVDSLDLPHYRIAAREAAAMDEEAAATVARALAGLPERTREVVERVVVGERSYREAAGELGVSVNTVKTLLRLGLKELRERLKNNPALWLIFCARVHPFR